MKKVWSILLVLVLVFTLSVGALAADEDEIPGTYSLSNMDDGSGKDMSSAIAAMAAMGMAASLDVHEDGSADFDLFGETMELQFDFENKTVSFEDESLDYTFEDGILTFGNEEGAFIFTRGELELKESNTTFDYYVMEEFMDSGEPGEFEEGDIPELILFHNGNAILSVEGEEVEMIFDFEEMTAALADGDGETLPFTLEDDLLILRAEEGDEDNYIVFRQADPGYVGPYIITELYSEEDGDLSEELTAMAAIGMTPTLTIDEDGVGVLDFFGESETLYFDFDKMTVTDEEGETEIPFSYEYGRITLEQEGATMVISRVLPAEEDAAEAAVQSNG